MRHLAGVKWDILLFILFFGSEFGSLNPKNWPNSVVLLVLGVPWLGSLCQNGTQKNRLLDPPVYIITFYHIQPKNVNHNIHIPRLHLPTAHLRNRPEISRPRPKTNSPGRCRNTAHSIITRPRTFPLASPCRGSAGSRRSRFIQQSAVWSGPAQHARPSHAAGRLGADSPNNRNATVAPRGGRETFIIDRVYVKNGGGRGGQNFLLRACLKVG